jgi:Zn-dependent membrane protease YugP
MLWDDVGKLRRVAPWIVDVGAGLLSAAILAMVVALPLTFALKPTRRNQMTSG